MKTVLAAAAVTALVCGTAVAQDAPNFIEDTYPDYAIGEALGLMGALEGDSAAIDVDFCLIDSQFIDAVQGLGCERFIDFP